MTMGTFITCIVFIFSKCQISTYIAYIYKYYTQGFHCLESMPPHILCILFYRKNSPIRARSTNYTHIYNIFSWHLYMVNILNYWACVFLFHFVGFKKVFFLKQELLFISIISVFHFISFHSYFLLLQSHSIS